MMKSEPRGSAVVSKLRRWSWVSAEAKMIGVCRAEYQRDLWRPANQCRQVRKLPEGTVGVIFRAHTAWEFMHPLASGRPHHSQDTG